MQPGRCSFNSTCREPWSLPSQSPEIQNAAIQDVLTVSVRDRDDGCRRKSKFDQIGQDGWN